jgi:hypothetical protein
MESNPTTDGGLGISLSSDILVSGDMLFILESSDNGTFLFPAGEIHPNIDVFDDNTSAVSSKEELSMPDNDDDDDDVYIDK